MAARELREGERVRTANGPVKVAENASLPGVHLVYNLEVETEHTFLASGLGVLSHNVGPCAGAIPQVANSKLANLVKDLYKGAKMPNRIGTGSTADAVRNEQLTGLMTNEKFHTDKAHQYVNALTNWLRNNSDALYYDRLVARSLLDDLVSALAGM